MSTTARCTSLCNETTPREPGSLVKTFLQLRLRKPGVLSKIPMLKGCMTWLFDEPWKAVNVGDIHVDAVRLFARTHATKWLGHFFHRGLRRLYRWLDRKQGLYKKDRGRGIERAQ